MLFYRRGMDIDSSGAILAMTSQPCTFSFVSYCDLTLPGFQQMFQCREEVNFFYVKFCE